MKRCTLSTTGSPSTLRATTTTHPILSRYFYLSYRLTYLGFSLLQDWEKPSKNIYVFDFIEFFYGNSDPNSIYCICKNVLKYRY
jgi:hypothetical protein